MAVADWLRAHPVAADGLLAAVSLVVLGYANRGIGRPVCWLTV